MKTTINFAKNLIIISLIALFITSCNNEGIHTEEFTPIENATAMEVNVEMSKKKVHILLENLAKALAKVFDESKEVRELVKSEALKKFNHDYDVLLDLIKDINLGDGTTLEQKLTQYINEEDLSSLLKEYPTITLFVPSLPNNSFSADKWDTSKEKPEVAIRSYNNVVPIYNAKGEVFSLLNNEIPGFPIVVLKENERVVVRDQKTSDNSSTFRSIATGIDFQFVDRIFDNTTNNPEVRSSSNILVFDYEKYQKAIDSYDYFKNNTEGWQRDYVYYNLTKEINKGPIDLRYKECVVGFEMINNGIQNVNKISEQDSDPKLDGYWHSKPIVVLPGGGGRSIYTPWTDGEFEFRIKVYHGAKNFGGSEHITAFRAQPEDLFEVTTDTSPRRSNTYRILKVENLYVNPNTPLFEWNLDYYSYSTKIVIEEVDPSQTQKITQTTTSEFATNFGFDLTFGDTVKQGLKFGASSKETKSFVYEVTTMLNNDELGEIIINFGDEIVMSKNNVTKNTRYGVQNIPNFNNKYETGYYRIHIAPKLFD